MSDAGHSGTADGTVEKTGVSSTVLCPVCGSDHPRRMERKGFMQMRILPIFGYYPWFCSSCKSTFMMRKRHRKKKQRKG